MNKNYLITTGGSGGHVIPAVILYEHLSRDAKVIITTDKRGLKYLNDGDYQLRIIDTPRLNNIFLFPINLILVIILTIKSFLLLKKNNIEKLFSTGGYMSLPLLLAAKFLRLKIYLLEPNQVLGKANKFFLSSCKKIICYKEKIKNFPPKYKNKIETIFPLVREKFYSLKRKNFNHQKINLLIVGGSQGANIFDINLKNKIVNISKKHSIRIFHQTSEQNILNLKNFYDENNLECLIFSFKKNFEEIINNSDICITRSGASTLAELSLLNIPFIAVPLPNSKDNHQFENALFYKQKECCWMLNQETFQDDIEQLLNNILSDNSEFLQKKENLKKLNYKNTWTNVHQKILNIINEN